jgi:hypothetical protein
MANGISNKIVLEISRGEVDVTVGVLLSKSSCILPEPMRRARRIVVMSID